MKASILVMFLSYLPIIRKAMFTSEMLDIVDICVFFFGFMLSVSIFENRKKILEFIEEFMEE